MTDAERPSWQRPPFEPGNELATTHGAYSFRRVEARAADLVADAVDRVRWLGDDSYRPALVAWARAEARAQLVAEYLDEQGLLDADGVPLPATTLALKLEKQAADHRARLGLDPASRARLHRDSGIGAAARASALSDLAEEGRRHRIAAEERAVVDASGSAVRATGELPARTSP